MGKMAKHHLAAVVSARFFFATRLTNSHEKLTSPAGASGLAANFGVGVCTGCHAQETADLLTSPNTNTSTGVANGKSNMGSAVDFNLQHNPGDYVHNRYYALRLIYVSIDWLDDNQLNYSIGTKLNMICHGGSSPTWRLGATTCLSCESPVSVCSAIRCMR